jgi:hypothetical protein
MSNNNNNNNIKPSKKPSFSPKHLKLLSFIKWFLLHSHNLPHHTDIPNSLYFLNLFLDHQDSHLHALKSLSKRHNLIFNHANKRILKLNLTPQHDLPHALHTLHLHQKSNGKNNNNIDNKMNNIEDIINSTEEKVIINKKNIPVPEGYSDFVKKAIESALS